MKFRVFSREYPVKTHEVKGLWKRCVWEYEKDGAQSVKKPLLIIIKGHYNDRFLWLTLPEIDYLCDQWNRPPDHKDENRETEVSQGFRFFVSGWGETKKLK